MLAQIGIDGAVCVAHAQYRFCPVEDFLGNVFVAVLRDAIVIGGSLPLMPETYKLRLKPGGRLFAIVGDSPVMECVLITRLGENEWTQEALFETDVPALVNAPQPPRFVF